MIDDNAAKGINKSKQRQMDECGPGNGEERPYFICLNGDPKEKGE